MVTGSGPLGGKVVLETCQEKKAAGTQASHVCIALYLALILVLTCT